MSDHANAIEAHAIAVKCERHVPLMRGCAWIDNQPCECREATQQRNALDQMVAASQALGLYE